MITQYHILNGDSLKDQFPKNILGETIIFRECLVDGSVKGKNLTDFFYTRACFISQNYEGCTEQGYYVKVVPEFEKIQLITGDMDINLWFEDDLFCQVNFWFLINHLNKSKKTNPIFLIRPKNHNQYGFSGLSKLELNSIYKGRLQLTKIGKLSELWGFYQNNDLEKLLKTATELEEEYPFVLIAVKAHIERIPTEEYLGKPSESLVQIMNELKTDQFIPVFKEFSKRQSIYGFGDLQVKRLLDEIQNNH